MERKLICGNKYELENNTIGLPVSFKDLPEKVKVHEYTFYLPNLFHVSLVYIGKIIEKYNILIPDFLNKVVNDFCNFTKANAVELTGFNNEYKFVDKMGFKTIVVMCEVSNLNKFFDLINKKYELSIKYPPTHVTLYNTLKDKPGVWLMDEDDIRNFTVPVPNPVGRLL